MNKIFTLCIALLGVLSSETVFAAQAELSGANTSWILTSTALVLLMTLPGLALFYGGLVRKKNVLSVLMQCFAIASISSGFTGAHSRFRCFRGVDDNSPESGSCPSHQTPNALAKVPSGISCCSPQAGHCYSPGPGFLFRRDRIPIAIDPSSGNAD